VDLNLSDAPYEFWMGGKHATKLVEISKDPAVLDDGNFWAISTTFEGVFTFARFDKVVDEEFTAPSWTPIEADGGRLSIVWSTSNMLNLLNRRFPKA